MAVNAERCAAGVVVEAESERAGAENEARELQIRVFLLAPSPHTLDLLRALSNHPGVNLELILRESALADKPWGQSLHGLRSRVLEWGRQSPRAQLRLLTELARSPAHLWVFGDLLWDPANLLLATLLRRAGVPTVFLAEALSERSLDFGADRRRLWQRVLPAVKSRAVPMALRCFTAIGAMGEWGRRQYEDLVPDRYCFATEYVVNLDAFRSLPRPASRRDRRVRLGFCGQLIRRKGVSQLVEEVFAPLAGRNDWEFVIAGDGPLRGEIDAQLSRYGIRDRVHFLGFLSQEELISSFWSKVDILLVPSLFDGWAMVVPEALAAGVPVVATPQVGAAHAYIRDGVNGWMREVGDFLGPVCELLDDAARRDELSRCARDSMESITPARVAADFVRAVTPLCCKTRS